MIRRAANDNRGILPVRRRRDWRVYLVTRAYADLIDYCADPVLLRDMRCQIFENMPPPSNDYRHGDLVPVIPPTASGNVNALLWEKRNAQKADRAKPMRYFIQKPDQPDDTPPA